MSIRRMMLFTLGGFFKSIISIFKTRVLNDGGNFEAENNLENQLNKLGSDLFNSASLVITPNGVKTSKLYSIKPNDGTGDLSVIRATTATRVNEQGLIEPVPYNLFSYSEDFGNSFWIKNNSTVTTNTNQTMSPIGTNTVDLYVPNTTLGEHQINPLFPYSDSSLYINSSNTYNWSIYVKSAGNNFFLLRVNINGTWSSVVFNLSSSSIVSAHPNFISAKIESVNDGWQLLSCVFTGVNGVNVFQHISSPTGDIAFSGNDTSGAYIWGAQLTIGTSKREYFATTDKLNVARIDYTTGSTAILVEPQRTNVHLNSSTMWNMLAFASSGGTVPTKSRELNITSPTGNNDAVVVVGGNGSTSSWGIYQTIPTVINAGQQVTVSVFAKAGSNNFILLNHANISFTGSGSAYFNLSNGTTPTNGARIEDWGNGWYRCIMPTITLTANTSGAYNIGCYVTPSMSTNIWTTDYTGKSVYFFGIQVEAGSNVTSYIPTTTSSVTRNADIISKSGISSLIGQTEGSVYCEINNITFNQNSGIFILHNDVDRMNNRLGFRYTYSPIGYLNAFIRTGTNEVVTLNSYLPIVGEKYKMCFTYNQTQQKFFINGVLVSSRTGSYAQPNNLNEVQLGSMVLTSFPSTVGIKSALVFKNVLTDQQAIQITTL